MIGILPHQRIDCSGWDEFFRFHVLICLGWLGFTQEILKSFLSHSSPWTLASFIFTEECMMNTFNTCMKVYWMSKCTIMLRFLRSTPPHHFHFGTGKIRKSTFDTTGECFLLVLCLAVWMKAPKIIKAFHIASQASKTTVLSTRIAPSPGYRLWSCQLPQPPL